MARPTDRNLFLNAVNEAGGRVSNGQLRLGLNWSEEKYWKTHQSLFEEGLIEKGRGYGGTVLLVAPSAVGVSSEKIAFTNPIGEGNKSQSSACSADVGNDPKYVRELGLYEPLRAQLQKHWAVRRQLDECHCEIVALLGSRDTGGSWSRPDLCVIGSRKFEFFPDRAFELHTFEVKGPNDVTVKGVLEALAHREAATRAYVLYFTGGEDFLSYPESARIQELASRHGVGVIVARKVDNIDDWDEVVPAQRALADPEAVNTFIGRSLSDSAKTKIRKWFAW